LTHLPVDTFACSHIHLLTHLPVDKFTCSHIHLLTYLPVDTFTCWHIHLLTHCVVTFTGYTLMGPDKRSCLSLGHWSGIETYCQDVTCPALSFTLNGYVDPPICTQTTQEYGVICRLRCYQGYTLDGPSFRQCSNTGTWTSASYSWRCLGTCNHSN